LVVAKHVVQNLSNTKHYVTVFKRSFKIQNNTLSKMNGLPPRIRYVQNHNQTEKYRVCQERITPDNPYTRDWLTTTGRAKYAVFYAVLDKEKDVVVKVGPDVLKKEYTIGKQLEEICHSIDNMEINFVRSEISLPPGLRPMSTRSGGKTRSKRNLGRK